MARLPKILIVGINPSSARPDKMSTSIKRLTKWADHLGIEYYSFINCIPRPGNYKFSDVDFEALREVSKSYDKIIALGGFPSRALKHLDIDHFMLPHPSGLNRLLNNKEYELKILGECNDYIKA